ncbi:hypothetical protein QVD17_41412 [Tagetes erecta]|uniref:Uncharacterized protein n=1 Tax=Tagetes erecta TaxID=13708 RepID=A0AAD8N8T8_TARER|nr:hypothetical protein QVD17_41412 [Tagetes erecta]
MFRKLSAVSHFFNLNSKHSAAAISSIPISSSLPLRFSFNTVTIATTTGGGGSRSSKVWGLFKLPFRSTSPSTPSPSPLPHLRHHRHHRLLLTTNNNNHSSTFGTSVLSKFYDVPALDRFEVLVFAKLLESVSLYDQELKDSFPNYDEAILDEMKDKEFAEWFQKHTTPRAVYQLDQDVREMVDDNVDVDHFFQENERVECLVTEDLIPFSFVKEDGKLEEVEDVDSDNVEEAEFEATNLVDSDFDNNDEVDFGNEDFDDEESE